MADWQDAGYQTSRFDYTHPEPNPSRDKSFHLQAQQSLTYIELLKLIEYLWEKGHPDVEFVPHSTNCIANPDKGYIVYWLQNMTPRKDFPKPQFHESIRDTEQDQDIEIIIQIFQCIVAFTAVHQNPETAELILETFEDFMMDYTPVLKQLGAGDVFYSRRYPDNEDQRIGQDMANRTVTYMIMIQKTRKIYIERLKEILIDARIKLDQIIYGEEQATPNVSVVLTDQFADLEEQVMATPNTIGMGTSV